MLKKLKARFKEWRSNRDKWCEIIAAAAIAAAMVLATWLPALLSGA